MARRSAAKQGEVHDESLVPMIENEEHRLAELLEEARRQAEQVVDRAQLESQERLRSVDERLPRLREDHTTRARAAFEKEADELRTEASAALAALKTDVEVNRQAAIAAVVEAVWPLPR